MPHSLDELFALLDVESCKRVNGWEIRRRADNVDVVLFTVPAMDEEMYSVRCECTSYSESPPGVVFINAEGSQVDPKAWPAGDAEFDQIVKPPPSCFLCVPLTREGLQYHNEWRGDTTKDPWNGSKHSLKDVFNLVHRLLNGPHYRGRRNQ